MAAQDIAAPVTPARMLALIAAPLVMKRANNDLSD